MLVCAQEYQCMKISSVVLNKQLLERSKIKTMILCSLLYGLAHTQLTQGFKLCKQFSKIIFNLKFKGTIVKAIP